MSLDQDLSTRRITPPTESLTERPLNYGSAVQADPDVLQRRLSRAKATAPFPGPQVALQTESLRPMKDRLAMGAEDWARAFHEKIARRRTGI